MVLEALDGPYITRGPKVEAFEKALTDKVGAKWAVAFNSGTSSLYASFFAADVTPQDRFITTPNSFIASSGVAMRLGIKPLFIDIDPQTGNLSLELLKKELDETPPPTRGRLIIMPVHFGGLPVDMKKLDSILKYPNVVTIEDGAAALYGSQPNGNLIGSCSHSDMCCFSFHPAKSITTGEGGAVTTSNEEYYKRLLHFRNNCIMNRKPCYYEVGSITGNYHMNEMEAALGLSQLERGHIFLEKKRELVKRYRDHFALCPLISMPDPSLDSHSAFNILSIQVDFEKISLTKEQLVSELAEKGIGVDTHYIPIYHHPAYKKQFGPLHKPLPHTELFYKNQLSIPLYPDLSGEDVDFIAQQLLTILK